MVWDRILEIVEGHWHSVSTYFSRADAYWELSFIILLFLPGWLLSRRFSPRLVERSKRLGDMPVVSRVVTAFVKRFNWFIYILLIAIAYALSITFSWPQPSFLIKSTLILATAWLSITVLSHLLKSEIMARVFVWVAWLYVAAKVFGLGEALIALLDSASFSFGEFRITLLGVIQTTMILMLWIWIALNVGSFINSRIQSIDELTPSLRVLFGKIVRITLVFIATLIALQIVGIDLTALTVLSGAVGVGIGFGLQRVVSNFISGIIILTDQSIKPGDTITLGETFGWIRELRGRFVSVITRDGREFLIPNEEFITTQVINWSFSDQFVRLDVDFGVSYTSDPHEVTRVAIEAAGKVGRVNVQRKEPVCWITGFGESSIDFKLRFWIEDPQNGLTNIRGAVMLALWDAFKEHDIQIPYPHRQVIIQQDAEPPADP